LGRRICTDSRPWPTSDHSSLGLFVVEEQRRALGVEQARGFAHHLLQQRAELDVGGDLGDDVDELHFLAADGLHALDELRALQGPECPGWSWPRAALRSVLA
jgi:hypothetical protein